MVRKWYFCVNEKGFDRTTQLMTVAVRSCLANTALRPVCIYNGDDARHVAALEAMGAQVVRHRSSFEDDLRAGYGDRFDIYSGHWLRVDLPFIEREDPVVLYTDIDVMFLKPPVVRWAPPYLAAASELHKWRYPHFNSGVMVMNLVGLRRVQDRFKAAIRERLRGDFRYPGHDQESFNRFFRWTYVPMRPRMNWKPYWGVNPDARILHFHGPKAHHARMLAEGKGERMGATYKDRWRRAPEAYAHYGRLWEGYLAG